MGLKLVVGMLAVLVESHGCQGVKYPITFYHSPGIRSAAPSIRVEILTFSGVYDKVTGSFIYPGTSYSVGNLSQIKALNDTGGVVGSITNNALYSYSLAVLNSGKIFVPGLNAQTVLLNLFNNGTIGTFFQELSIDNINHTLNLHQAATFKTDNFVFVTTKLSGLVYKFDVTNLSAYETSDFMLFKEPVSIEIFSSTQLLLYGRTNNFFVRMLALNLSFTTTTTGFIGKVSVFKVEANDSAKGYAASLYSPFELRRIDLDTTTDLIVSQSTGVSKLINSILLVGGVDYLILGFEQPNLQLVKRSDLSMVNAPLSTVYMSLPNSLIGTHVVDDMNIFSVISAGEIYFFKYMEIYCAIPGQVPCTNCQIDFYLTVNNTCLDKPNFAVSEGVFERRVVACSDRNCLACVDNFAICTKCDTSKHYFVYSDICILNSTIKDKFGPLLTTGIVYPCLDVYCLYCKNDTNQCDQCDPDYTLSAINGTCISNPGLPSTKGPNNMTGVMTTCQTGDCDKCKVDYHDCDWCLLGYSVVNASSCLLNSLIDDQYGPNLATGKISQCVTTECKTCKADHTICTWCMPGYALENNICTKFEMIVDGRGPNLATGGINDCATVQCKNCKRDYLICDRCNDNYGLLVNVCYATAGLSPGYGVNLANSLVQYCEDNFCKDCRFDIRDCTICSEDYYFNENMTCLHYLLIKDRFGANLTTQRISKCVLANCRECKKDHTVCSNCIEGFELRDGECRIVVHRLDVLISPNTAYPYYSGSDASFIVGFNDTMIAAAGEFDDKSKQIKDDLFKFSLLNKITGESILLLGYNIRIGNPQSKFVLVLELGINQLLNDREYLLGIYNPVVTTFDRSGTFYGFNPFNYTFDYINNRPRDAVVLFNSVGRATRLIIGDAGPGYWPNYILSILKVTLIYLDQSGFVARYLHQAQRLQKLSQLNINYGPKLDSFLSTLNEHETQLAQRALDLEQLKHLRAFRGKVTHQEWDFYRLVFFKLLIYFISWGFRGVSELIVAIDWNLPDWWLRIMFYHQRIHLALFSFLLMDLLSYSFNVTTAGAEAFQAFAGYFALILLSADLIEIADVMVRRWRWSYRSKALDKAALENDLKVRQYLEAEEFDIIDKRKFKKAYSSKYEAINDGDERGRYINHYSTYERLDAEIFKVRFLEGPLKQQRQFSKSGFVRLHDAAHFIRMFGFQLIVYLAPYSTAPGIIALACLEGSVILYVSFVYLMKHRYLRNPILYCVEIARSFLMGGFLLIAFSLRDKHRGESFDDSSDSLGVQLVIAMIIVEIFNVLFQIVHYYWRRRVEPRDLISYDKYVWKRSDNLFAVQDHSTGELKTQKTAEMPCLDELNTDGLCISKKTVQKLKIVNTPEYRDQLLSSGVKQNSPAVSKFKPSKNPKRKKSPDKHSGMKAQIVIHEPTQNNPNLTTIMVRKAPGLKVGITLASTEKKINTQRSKNSDAK